jgi:glutaredoxin
MNKLTLEVYGQEGCQPCKALKQKLEKEGYNVEYYDIGANPDARYYQLRS